MEDGVGGAGEGCSRKRRCRGWVVNQPATLGLLQDVVRTFCQAGRLVGGEGE